MSNPIELTEGSEFQLATLGVERIIIDTVEAGSFDDLTSIIWVHVSLPDGSSYRHPISEQSRYSLNSRIPTVKNINHIVEDCRYASLSWQRHMKTNAVAPLKIWWREFPYIVDELEIVYSAQSDGFNFSLQPKAKAWVVETFSSDTMPVRLFVSHSQKFDFENVHGSIIPHVVFGVTGLSRTHLSQIKFIRLRNLDSSDQGELISTREIVNNG